MGKRTSKAVKHKKDTVKHAQKSNSKLPEPSREEEQENHMDFGGLPDVNLKKNLGCG